MEDPATPLEVNDADGRSSTHNGSHASDDVFVPSKKPLSNSAEDAYDDGPFFQPPAPLAWSRTFSAQERVSPKTTASPADTHKRYMESPRASPLHSPRVWPPSSPRVDAIPSISQRVEQLARGGRVIQMLKNASKVAPEIGSSSTLLSYDSNPLLNNGIKRRKKSTKQHALYVVDKYLRRRHAFALLDSDMIICGTVSDKTTAGLVVVIAEVFTGPEVNTKDPKTRPALSSLSRNQTDAFQDIESLQISCICQLCEIRGSTEDNSNLDRFAIGDFVKALVISVDVHSEKVYISLNNARIKNMIATHRLGLMPRPPEAQWQAPSPAAFNNPYSSSSAPSTFNNPYSTSFNPYGSITTASFNPYGSTSFNPYGSTSASALNPYASPLPSLRTPSFNYSYSGYESQTKAAIKSDFCKKLRSESMFRNPQGIDIMLAAYNINSLGSLLSSQAPDPALNYKTLRNAQNQAWAKDSVTRGIALAKQGNLETALQCYEHALEIDPSFTHAFIARGAAYVLQGKLKEAIAEFEYALRLDPMQSHAKRYLQIAQDKLKDVNAQEEKSQPETYGDVVSRCSRSSSRSHSSLKSNAHGSASDNRRVSTAKASDSEDERGSPPDGGLLAEREKQIARFLRKQQKEAKKHKKKKKEKEKKKSKKKKQGKSTKKKKAKETSSSSSDEVTGPRYSVQSSFVRDPTPTFHSSRRSSRSVVDLTEDRLPPFPVFSDDEKFSPQFLPISPQSASP